MEKILVAVDGSLSSVFAVDFAADLALKLDAELVIFTVASDRAPAEAEAFARMEHLATSAGDITKVCAEGVLERAEQQARKRRGLRISSHWRFTGDAATEIAGYARNELCDLIVVGHRDRGIAAQVILGSVARRLLEIAPCPVTIVPEKP